MMDFWIGLGVLLAVVFGLSVLCYVVIGPLYCYGCGRFPDNKLSFCSDCIREGKRRYGQGSTGDER